MPTARLPFDPTLAPSLSELGGASPRATNILVDSTGTVRSRPGVKAWSDFGTAPVASPVIGMIPYNNALVFVTADRYIWKWIGEDTVLTLSSSTASTQLAGTGRPVFVDAGDDFGLIIAGGGAPQKISPAGVSARLVTSPPACTHMAVIKETLIAPDMGLTGTVYYTDPDGSRTTYENSGQWSNSFQVEADADPVRALHATYDEIVAFGTRTIQVYVTDFGSASDFAPVRTLALGLAAPYSVLQLDDSWAFLDHLRRIVVTTGRTIEVLSAPYLNTALEAMATIDDCWAFRARIGAHDLLTWVFPTEQRTFCLDMYSKKWGEWRSHSAGAQIAPAIRSYCYWVDKNLHLVGLSDGTIGVLDLDTATESSQPILATIRTGFVSHDTLNKKHCAGLDLQMKRGLGSQSTSTASPLMELSWRDDTGAFCKPMRVDVGRAGDYNPVARIRSLGTYRQREWEMSVSDNIPWALSNAQETFTVLET